MTWLRFRPSSRIVLIWVRVASCAVAEVETRSKAASAKAGFMDHPLFCFAAASNAGAGEGKMRLVAVFFLVRFLDDLVGPALGDPLVLADDGGGGRAAFSVRGGPGGG